ncbi:MAG: ISKra4 family transposase [Shimia sp.]|nr:ISKra4 family transposase [Shimia sp.]
MCHQGHYPLDERLGLRPNQMSAELERLAGLVGVQMAFDKGSQVFEELTLVSLSDHSLDKSAQAYGREVDQVEQDWQTTAADQATQLKRKRETRPVLRLYGAMDGAMMHVRGDQEHPWRELKIGAWFQARGRPPQTPDGQWRIQAENITYFADVCKAQAFGELLWASGLQRNADQAVELIFIGDGAAWIWRLVDQYFPQAIQIVDWFHACEYLVAVARAAFSETKKRQDWLTTNRTALWKGQLDAVINACQAHVQPDRDPDDDPAQQAVTYFTNNRQRMDYPTYRHHGYQIGSGTIESAAKQIVSQRMKVTGAIWNLKSARLVAKARAAFLSDQWHDLAARRTHLNRAA